MMPRRRPNGWPRYMDDHRLRSGATAYYWKLPSWAKRAGCPLRTEALGTDYGEAKRRCDEILNPQLDAWRTRGDDPSPTEKVSVGTFDWMAAVYKTSPKFTGKAAKTRKGYDAVLRLVSDYTLKDGRRFGTLTLHNITPGAADRLYEKLKARSEGGERTRTAILAMAVCKRAWNVARRDRPEHVPLANPFAKMDLAYKATPTRPVSYDELMRFVAAADEAWEASIGTAAMIAFFWLQRQEDIVSRLTWGHYRPADAPHQVKIFHHKTGELVSLPLYDEDGSALWPEIMSRLDAAPRLGTLIVTRDRQDRRRKINLPWQLDYFRHRVAEIRQAAGIDPDVKFMGLRHGGNVEGAEAGLTDAQLRALSGHRTTAALLRYAQATEKQRLAGARKRRDARTKREICRNEPLIACRNDSSGPRLSH
jgi:hypothetical protein